MTVAGDERLPLVVRSGPRRSTEPQRRAVVVDDQRLQPAVAPQALDRGGGEGSRPDQFTGRLRRIEVGGQRDGDDALVLRVWSTSRRRSRLGVPGPAAE